MSKQSVDTTIATLISIQIKYYFRMTYEFRCLYPHLWAMYISDARS